MGELEDFLKQLAEQTVRNRAPEKPSEEIVDAVLIETEPNLAEVVESDTIRSREASRVSEHLEGSVFSDPVSHQSGAVDQSDERMDSHLHGVFDHRLGALGASTPSVQDSTIEGTPMSTDASMGSQIIAMLQSPDTLRNAIILTEIINRPVHRWRF